MKTMNIIMDHDRKIWVFNRISEIDKFFCGDTYITKISEPIPEYLRKDLCSFLLENKEQEEIFNQAFGYWIICDFFKTQEKLTAYGMLKRKLNKKDKLYRKTRNFAISISHKLKKELNKLE